MPGNNLPLASPLRLSARRHGDAAGRIRSGPAVTERGGGGRGGAGGGATYVASMLRGLGLWAGRPHQATLVTAAGWDRACRHLQPAPGQGQAHSFTVSSLAQVRRTWPLGSHRMQPIASCGSSTALGFTTAKPDG